jgi:ABC-2 type transport system permease protein
MRLNHIKALIEVDLLQSNRQLANNNRAEKLQKKNIYWRMLLQNVAVIFIFVLLFGTMLSNVPLVEFPGIFSQTIGFMILFSLLQIFQLIYNLFYDETDLSTYLSLPFTVSELFTSKIATIIITSFAYFISPLIFMVILGQQTGTSFAVSIPIGLISTVLIMLVTILGVFILLDLLNRWSFFRKNKKVFTIIIYVVLFGFIFYNLYGNDIVESTPGMGILDHEINPLFVGFHEVFIPGMQLKGWIKIGLWFIIGLALMFIMYKWVVPQLYSENEGTVTTQKRKRKKTQTISSTASNSKWKVFVKYQLRQLQDTTLILQMLFSKFYLPIIMIAPTLFNGASLDLSILDQVPYLWGAYLIIGVGLAVIMISETSISGVIISFDKENYYYIQSLPISFRNYLKFKFYFAFVIEWMISAIVIIGIALYLRVPILPLAILLIGYTVGTYVASLYYYMRDYRLLNLSWNNFNELMQRGVSQAIRIFIQLFVIFVGVLAIFGLIFWFVFIINDMTRLIISLVVAILLLGGFLGINRYAEKKFWSQFNQ